MTTVTAAPGAHSSGPAPDSEPDAAAASGPASGLASQSSTTWVSGSPNLALNSTPRRPRRAEAVQRPRHLRLGVAGHRAGRRDTRRGHDLLGERLRTLDHGGTAAGPEAAQAGPAQRVGEPGNQWCLRADDDQSGSERTGQ